jgi:hypothetical protein
VFDSPAFVGLEDADGRCILGLMMGRLGRPFEIVMRIFSGY